MSFELQFGLIDLVTASRLNKVFGLVCGQNPEHTWAPGGMMLPCCERCLGLYAGATLALLLHLWLRPKLTGRFLEWHGLFLLLMVPLGFHWVQQGAVQRTTSGVLFGAGVTTFLWLPLGARALRIPRSVLECCGRTKWRRSFRNASASFNAHACNSGYATGIVATAVLLPFLASHGGRLAAFLLAASAAAGLLSLAVLVLANLLLAMQGAARVGRALRCAPSWTKPRRAAECAPYHSTP